MLPDVQAPFIGVEQEPRYDVSVHIAAALAFLIAGAGKPSARPIAQTIRIHARWGGLGQPVDETFTISRSADGYRLGAQRVDNDAVPRLVRALTAPAIPEKAGIEKLVPTEWLKTHSNAAYRIVTTSQGECSPAARNLFMVAFNNSNKAATALQTHYGSMHTDDYPSIVVSVSFSDGHVMESSSHSQHALMLPFKTGSGITWNADVPRAIAALMPPDSKLRPRLLGDDLVKTLAEEINQAIRPRWEELEERCLYAKIVTKLETRFTIEETYHAWPGQFAGHLVRWDFPPNLLIDVHISSGANEDRNVATFMQKIETYLAGAGTFVTAHRDHVFELEYFDGTSVREDDLQLREINHPGDVNTRRVRNALSDCVLLRDHNDPYAHRNWVVLPSGEVIDWDDD
jgi:hypothetical protein